MNDNRALLNSKLRTGGLKLKTTLKAGGASLNHNEALIGDDATKSQSGNTE